MTPINAGEFQKLRKAAKLNRDRMKRSDKRAEFLKANQDVIDYAEKRMEEASARFERKHGYPPDPEFDDIGFDEWWFNIIKRFNLTVRQLGVAV